MSSSTSALVFTIKHQIQPIVPLDWVSAMINVMSPAVDQDVLINLLGVMETVSQLRGIICAFVSTMLDFLLN